MPLVIADVFSRFPVGDFVIQVNDRKIPEGFYQGIGITDVIGTLRIVDKLDKIGPERSRRCSSSRARRPSRPTSASRSPRSAPSRPRLRRAGARRSASSTRCSTRGSSHSPTSSAPGWPTRPASSSPTCGSPAASTTTPAPSTRRSSSVTSRGARSAPAAATTRSPATAGTPTPASASRSASPASSACSSAVAWSPRPARRPPPCSSRSTTTRRARRAVAIATALRRRGIAVRGRSLGREVRQADPLRRAAGHTVRLVPRRAEARRGDEVKDIRSGEQVPAGPTRGPRRPRTSPPGHPRRLADPIGL